MSIAFDLNASQNVLRSRGTILCITSDKGQCSAYIEELLNQSQMLVSENSLKVTECYLIFATEIWFESLAKKGLNLLGELADRSSKLGDLFARENSVQSM